MKIADQNISTGILRQNLLEKASEAFEGNKKVEDFSKKMKAINISAKENLNINVLKESIINHIQEMTGNYESSIISNSRHYDILFKTKIEIEKVRNSIKNKVPSDLIRTFSGVVFEVLNTIFPEFDGLSTTICKSPSAPIFKETKGVWGAARLPG